MASLDDKLMGEKLHYYCSSSSEDEAEEVAGPKGPAPPPPPSSHAQSGVTINTGPKGVVKDWQRYKQLEAEMRQEQAKERMELVNKLSLSCRTAQEDEAAKKREEEDVEAEIDSLLDDDFFQEYMTQRMREMEKKVNSQKTFRNVTQLNDGEDFLKCLDSEDKTVVVIVYVYARTTAHVCDQRMNEAVRVLAINYPFIKFASIEATAVGFSKHFTNRGVPALLVYKAGDLVTSFPRLTDSLGEDIYPSDVEGFLVENGILSDRTLIPTIIRGPAIQNTSDSE